MALAQTHIFSDVLGMSTSLHVILPQATTAQIGMVGERTAGDPPVLYLLHGLSDDDSIWLRRTSIERYAADYGIAVVMPRVERSFYQDMAHGEKYWTYLSQELPAIVAQLFRVSIRREDTFVAGLSMGGYGAMRLALAQPERHRLGRGLSLTQNRNDGPVAFEAQVGQCRLRRRFACANVSCRGGGVHQLDDPAGIAHKICGVEGPIVVDHCVQAP